MENLKDLITILYYTSNREKPEFEKKTQAVWLNYGLDLPIISVSQKPMDLGKNICVGDVGASGYNMFRQVLIGCEAATTKFILSVECDDLYPPDYFSFLPEREDICYRDKNLFILGHKRSYFYHKWNPVKLEGGQTNAQIVGREFYIKTLKDLFGDGPEWSVTEKNFPKERRRQEDVFKRDKILYYETVNPVITIKTGDGMRHYTASNREPVMELPYWGTGEQIRRKFL